MIKKPLTGLFSLEYQKNLMAAEGFTYNFSDYSKLIPMVNF